MKTKIYILLFTFAALSLFPSCEQEDRRYNGPLYVEFSPDQYGQTAAPSGIVKNAPGIGEDQIGVQLIGLAQSEALTVNFRMVDQVFYIIALDRYVTDLPDSYTPGQYRTILATAKYGVDYTFEGLSGVTFDRSIGRGSFSIPSGSQFGTLPINVLTEGGSLFFCVLDDSETLRANKPTALLRCQTHIDKIVLLDERFATDPFGRGWTEIDRDGDGYTWEMYGQAITSDSWKSRGIGAIHPENYLISPPFTIPANAKDVTLTFQVAAAGDDNDYKEQYRVVISEQEITFDNCRDAEIVQDWTMLTEDYADETFVEISIDLSKYKGKTVYLGIVHGNCTNQYYIIFRNLSVFYIP